MPASTLARLECSCCQRESDPDRIAQLCPCGAPLLARYDLARARRSLTRKALEGRPDGLWRFRELLPVRSDDVIVSLGERITPILSLRRVGEMHGLGHLSLKDEGLLPTGSFKARGAAIGVSRARELGVSRFAMPSNGNAGCAWAMYGARAGLSATIVMPAASSAVHQRQCVLAGASVFLVEGLIGDAGRIVARAVAQGRFYDTSTLKEPYRIEGKKTLGFEIAEQSAWELPDVIIYPTGGGVGLIGMHKAFSELKEIGLIEGPLPRFVAVQSSGCAPIVEAWRDRKEASVAWEGAATIAFGINVPKALGDFLVLRALYETGGMAVAVDDRDILKCQRELIACEGVFACPEGGATLAAAACLREEGAIAPDERVLLINTGSGAIASDAPPADIPTVALDGELPLP